MLFSPCPFFRNFVTCVMCLWENLGIASGHRCKSYPSSSSSLNQEQILRNSFRTRKNISLSGLSRIFFAKSSWSQIEIMLLSLWMRYSPFIFSLLNPDIAQLSTYGTQTTEKGCIFFDGTRKAMLIVEEYVVSSSAFCCSVVGFLYIFLVMPAVVAKTAFSKDSVFPFVTISTRSFFA